MRRFGNNPNDRAMFGFASDPRDPSTAVGWMELFRITPRKPRSHMFGRSRPGVGNGGGAEFGHEAFAQVAASQRELAGVSGRFGGFLDNCACVEYAHCVE